MNDLQLLRCRDVAELVRVNPSTLWRWTKRGDFPSPLRIGKNSIRWRASEVEEWLQRQATND